MVSPASRASLSSLVSQECRDSPDTQDTWDSQDSVDTQDSRDTNSILNLEFRITNKRSRTPGSIETPDRNRLEHMKGNLKQSGRRNCSKQGLYRVFDQIRNAASGARLQFETKSGVKVAE